MASPYGIEQVDVPGVMGAMQGMQFNRIRMMLAQKQLDAITGASKALSAYYGNGSQGSSESQENAGNATGAGPSGSDIVAKVTQPFQDAATAATQGPSAQPAAPSSMLSAGPKPYIPPDRSALYESMAEHGAGSMVGQYAEMFKNMDAQQIDRYKAINGRLVDIGNSLLQLPPAQRPAALQSYASELQGYGYPSQLISSFDTSDQNIRAFMTAHMEADKAADFAKQQYQAVWPGGTLASTTPSGTVTPVYETPIVQGPNGVPYARPPSMSSVHPQVHTKADYDALPPGTTYTDPNGVARVKGGQTPTASGGFQ